VAAGHAVARRGQDARRGDLVVTSGTTLGPAHLAVLATFGCGYPMVTVRPRAVVLSTGDELVSHDQSEVRAVQTRDANGPMLQSLVRRLGADLVASGRVPDRRTALFKAIRHAFDAKGRDADVLFLSGGMSMGEKDHVPGVLRELGFELPVTKLRIRPGKPFVFAVRPADGKFAFGLPGNPVSAFVCTVRLAARLLRRMTGQAPEPRWLEAALVEAVGPNGPREFYQPAVWATAPAKGRSRAGVSAPVGVRCLPWKGSADIFTLARAGVLVVRPENDRARQAWERVRVLEIPT
jgi:molybdopterin molybdotransferase